MSTIVEGSIIPGSEIDSGIFENQNGRNFWIGRISTLDSVEAQKVYDASSILRAKVYSKLGYISVESIDNHGRELDEDDNRSVHFAVLEKSSNEAAGKDLVRVIGTSRLIVKDSLDRKLPIEGYFPEVFDDNPIEVDSTEGSRLIANHEERRIQYFTALSLVRAMTYYSVKNQFKADYGMAEAPLLRLFDISGIPTTKLGASKNVQQYGGVLFPVKIETRQIADKGPIQEVGSTALRNFFANGATNHGEGFYNESFLDQD